MPHAHQRQVFGHLVAERPRPHNQHLGLCHLFTLPPGDQLKGPLPVGLEVGHHQRFFRRDRQPPGSRGFIPRLFIRIIRDQGEIRGCQLAGIGKVGGIQFIHEPAHPLLAGDQLVLLQDL